MQYQSNIQWNLPLTPSSMFDFKYSITIASADCRSDYELKKSASYIALNEQVIECLNILI